MPPGKRELARIERRLITTLTEACETAKGENQRLYLAHPHR
ncbi:hypothetical protein AB7M25_003121 [Pseudomonas sp. AP3_22 TE3818]